MDETEHSLTKLIVQTVVVTAIGSAITKTLLVTVPPTRKFKLAELAGTVAAAKLVATIERPINDLIDKFYERRSSRKSLKLF
jgi:hypothetical protein